MGTLKGKYIIANRAAQLSGYTRDYVTSLCRKNNIECRKISGEWMVDLRSLLAYKKRFDKSACNHDVHINISTNDDDVIRVDGFISSNTASIETGYSQDYIGQLARDNVIRSKKVGRKWFIDIDELKRYKDKNDKMLAKVQATSVGLKYPIINSDVEREKSSVQHYLPKKEFQIPKVAYTKDDADMIPSLHRPPQLIVGHGYVNKDTADQAMNNKVISGSDEYDDKTHWMFSMVPFLIISLSVLIIFISIFMPNYLYNIMLGHRSSFSHYSIFNYLLEIIE